MTIETLEEQRWSAGHAVVTCEFEGRSCWTATTAAAHDSTPLSHTLSHTVTRPPTPVHSAHHTSVECLLIDYILSAKVRVGLVRAEELQDEESGYYLDKRLRLRVEVAAEASTEAARPLSLIEFGVCVLPFSVKRVDCHTAFETKLASDREDDLEQYQALLHPNVINNLMDELESNAMVMAGVTAPNIHVRLPQQDNHSSLRYSLPPPDPSSLSIEWAFEGQPCLLQYQPAVWDENEEAYLFRPVVERKEGEPVQLMGQGEGVVAVGRSGKLDKAGKWSYRVTYTEQRPRLADVLTNRVQTNTVIEEVLPSIPHALRVQRSDESSASMPIVDSSDGGNRVIGRNIRLFIIDEYGSVVHLPLMSDALKQAALEATWIVEPVVDNSAEGRGVQRRTPPRFRVEQAVLNAILHCVVLPSVTVIDSPDGVEADSGPAPFAAQFRCSLRFFFSNEKQVLEEKRVEEQGRSAKRQQLAVLLTQAQADVGALKDELFGQARPSRRSTPDSTTSPRKRIAC